jgi:HK97 family phage portal protein
MPGILERWRGLFRQPIYHFSFGPDAPDQVLNLTARNLYNTQDNLAAVVDFISSSIAQLPLKVYTRDENDERKRDRDSVAAKLLWLPNNDQTEYEFMFSLVEELKIFGCVYVLKLPDPDSESGLQLRIIPTDWVTNTEKVTPYGPDKIRVTADGYGSIEIPREEFVPFRKYSPGNPSGYVSPISALRQTLEEQIQAGRFRKELWRSSGRLNAQIVRPKDVQPWTEETKKKWVEAFREAWGAGGSKAGSIPLMEDGMEIKTFNASFKEQQWVESVKLSREAVAAAYRINPSLVWHSDTQTYASSKDNARALYAECLGPDLQMIQQRINSFLLPMIGASSDTYVEFDLTEKLKGDFEQRAAVIQSSVGGPWLTRNEARRDNNLPPIEGGDELIVPLNVVTGGQASPQDTHSNQMSRMVLCSCGKNHPKTKAEEEPEEISISGKVPQREQDKVADLLDGFFRRQAKSIIPKLGAEADWWNEERWNKELADDLEPVMDEIATKHGEKMAGALGVEYIAEKTVNYLRKMAEGRAETINAETKKKIQQAVDDADEDEEDPEDVVRHEMDKRSDVDAALLGAMLSKVAAGWGTEEATRQATDQGSRKKVFKVWETGANARESHQLMDGETVPIDEPFSNGADWPGDDSLDPDESCGCNCSTRVIIIEE